MPHPRLGALALAALLTVGIAACSDDDADSSTGTTPANADGSTTTTEAPEPDSEGPIDVVASDYAFGGLPDSIPVGTTLTLVNESTTEVHELVAFRLLDDETRSADELIALPQGELEALFAGPPAAVLVAPPASDGFAVAGDGTLSEPGRYLAFCAIPTGADPSEYLAAAAESQGGPVEVDGGPPHFVQGMYAEVSVE